MPVFSNRPADYREWRQRINLYYKKMVLQKRPQEATINLVTTLTGVAWKQIEHDADKLCEDDQGFAKVLQILDKTFKYDDRVEQPRSFEKFFYQVSRRPGQTLMSYCSEHREHQREVEKHGIKLPDEIAGWLLLRRAGLSQEQRQLVLSQTSSTLAEEKVEQALYYLFGQDYRGKISSPEGYGKGDRHRSSPHRWQKRGQAYAADDEEYYEDDELFLAEDEDETAYYEEQADYDAADYADVEDDETAYNAQSPDDTYYDMPEHDDPELEEAYATYLDARRRFSELKTNRNFYPVVALGPEQQGYGSQQTPHRPPSRGKSKGKGKRTSPPQKGDAKSRGKAAFSTMSQQQPRLCLKCHQPGHFAADCPQKRSPSSTTPSPAKKQRPASVMMVQELIPGEIRPAPEIAGIFAQQDGGASCLVCGHDVLMHYVKHFSDRGFSWKHFEFRPILKTLNFGGDRSLQSKWSVHLPVFVHGSYGRIQCFIVEGRTPLLLGRPLLAALKVDISYADEQMRVDKGDWFPIPLGPQREHLLQLDDAPDDRFAVPPELSFDFVTTETMKIVENTSLSEDELYDLHQYLENTNREPPEIIFGVADLQESQTEPNDDDKSDAATEIGDDEMHDEEDEESLVRHAVTNKLIKTLKLHQHMLEQKRRQTMDNVMKAHDGKILQFWEVYSGEARLAEAMQKKGYLVQTFDLFNGWDFTRADHRTAFSKLQYETCPDMMWLAPPCTKWSALQHLNCKIPADFEFLAEERYYEERTHLRFTRNAHNRQFHQHRHSATEHPWYAESWKTSTFHALEGHDAEVDQCQYGSTLPDDDGNEQLIKKKTCLRVTDERLAMQLTRLCQGDHFHLPIEGSSPGIGNRAKAAGAYSLPFCRQVADIIDKFLYKHYVNAIEDYDTEPSFSPVTDYYSVETVDSTTINSTSTPTKLFSDTVLAEGDEDAGDEPQEQPPQPGYEQPPPPPEPTDDEEDPQLANQTGILQRLQETRPAMAARTIQRLHRNLGHPTNLELHKLLASKQASEALLAAAKEHKCELCALFQAPKQASKSGVRHGDTFNERVQADTVWIHLPPADLQDKKAKGTPVPVLSIIDTTTKFMSARVVPSEMAVDLVIGLERGWLKHFGPPGILQVDDHRSWSSDYVKSWCDDNGIQMDISPGQAHTRLGIVERRHRVLRRAIDIYLMDHVKKHGRCDREALTTALCYVVPQINNQPNIKGFSATQWAMGLNPRVPGVLMDSDLTVAQLNPSLAMEEKLRNQQRAAHAVIEADNDVRLRRALLRQHQANQFVYEVGQQVFYWRDAPGGAGPKLRWRGPAVIVMVEPGKTGPTNNTYWLTHGTTLLRVSGEHLRPHLDHQDTQDPMSRAKQALDAVRGRSTTLYIDLDKSNKRKRTEVLSEEEADDDIPMLPGPSNVEAAPEPQDHWDVHEDGITWTRIHVQPREELYVPRDDQTVPWQNFRPDRLTTIRRPPPFTQRTVLQDDWQLSDASRRMPFSWTGSTTFTMRVTGQQGSPTTPVTSITGNMPSNETTEPSPTAAPAAPIDRQTSQQEPEPPPPDSGMDSTEQSMQTIPEHQRQLYQAPPEGETFAQQRARFDRQETLSMYETAKGPVRYGPHREPFATDRQQERTPYSRPAVDEPDIQDNITTVVDVDVTKSSTHTLPPGWRIEDGYITLDMDNIQDEWVLHNNTLIRRHYNPRKTLFHPDSDECTLPIPIECLAKDRTSKMAGHVHHDRWRNKKSSSKTNNEWTGYTSFKILPCFRHLAKQAFYKTSNGHSSFQGNDGETCHYQEQATAKAAPKAKARKEQLSERQMSLQDRLAFLEAKKSELDSFFKNDVWEADSMENVPEGRLLKAHFILKWSKWADGSPRAKARLITQGFKDPDALNGMIDTEAPTLSRLSRNFILSVLCNLQWINFSADISTAFLQGKKHADNRTLWIALPADARRILGFGSEDKVMKLKKPMYGLCDAPRAWYLEARDRLCRLGAVQHPLDPCLFLIYDWEAPDEQWTVQKELTNNEEFNRHPPLCGLLGLHVDDLLGGGDSSNKSYQKFITALKENFQFRSWEEEKSVEYCGAKIERISSSHYEISHKAYLEKQKPISCESLSKHKPDTNEISAKERTLLRGLIGALQWPATQSSPHLQAMVSGMAGSVNSATVGTLKEANKALRFAKQHSDVTLQYKRLGDPSELTFMTYCDAAFASRADLSSQGGYLVMMVNKDVTTGQEGSYQLIDWRSWKLPRVARSSLAAESQAASEAADAMLYASTFWKLMWAPNLPLDDPMTPKLKNNPCLVTDAKALYDLLIRQDLQSSGGADKRTTIEVLVTKDKLRCAAATVKWLSSELQFADGMTKSSAAMLLAQRLRTHMTRIKPDPNFVAAKKKTPEQRKASQEQYAVKKPEKALLAVLSTTLMHPVMADETEGAFSSDNMLFLVFFTLIMMFAVHGFLCGVQRTWRSLPHWSTMMTRSPWASEQSCAEYHLEMTATETAVQTDPRPSDDTLVGLRRQVKDLTRRLEQTEEYSEALERQNGRMRQECDQQLETLRKRYDDRLREEITVRLQKILNKPVYHTNHGECWHASEVCAREATLNPIHVKRPCKKCYYNYPEVYMIPDASSTSSTGVSLTLSNE